MKLNAATDVVAELPEPDLLRCAADLGIDVKRWQRDLLNGVDLRVVHVRKRRA